MSLEMALVWKVRLGISEVVRGLGAAKLLWLSSVSVSCCFSIAVDSDQLSSGEVLLIKERGGDELGTRVRFQRMRGHGRRAGPSAEKASLVAQWLRICLPMQGTRVRALVWEDPTCRGATRPVSHNY